MANGNSFNNRIPASTTGPFLAGALKSPVNPTPDCRSVSGSATTTPLVAKTLSLRCTGTPTSPNFGVSFNGNMMDSANALILSSRYAVRWQTATHGSTTSKFYHQIQSASSLINSFYINSTGYSTDNSNVLKLVTSTFTPVVFGGVTSTGTYTKQIGRSWKLGQMTYVLIICAWSAHDGAGGTASGGSLPYTVANDTNIFWQGNCWANSLTYGAAKFLQMYVSPNTTGYNMNKISSGAAAATFALPASGEFAVSFYYTAV